MLLTALPPAPPTPNTVIRGLSSVRSGTLRLIVMVACFLLIPFRLVLLGSSHWLEGCP